MAWPFTNGTIAPDFEIGPQEMLVGSPDLIADVDGWLLGAMFQNTSENELTLVVTNRDGGELIGPIAIPAGAPYAPEGLTFCPFRGLRVGVSGEGLTGHLWGYEDA